jgi:hypothetical protein
MCLAGLQSVLLFLLTPLFEGLLLLERSLLGVVVVDVNVLVADHGHVHRHVGGGLR